ncbi:uncharacterized protein BDZ99DRAFT_23707 [Mytilinidion resinicola]|uniref:Uncharacterized protein n=1 Tax=Mytilinidion resinicola TaxID=574789 RepID=A0A6A6ZA89_9PEZI|nr:uncharacterized protein BDZ99DRAFT_23707 [Mytilinidion resinicola]KAF2817748.1 hypothetical protein BDZ99DRAFT_23707 [Mytilinidion resinicola]
MIRPENANAAPSQQQTQDLNLKPLERSSWKAEAIRRGRLKISGPIPRTTDEDDEELAAKRNTDPFPQRADSLSAAQRLLHKKSLHADRDRDDTAPASDVQQQDTASPSPPRLRHKRSSTAIRDLNVMQRDPPEPDLSKPEQHRNPAPSPTADEMAVPKKRRKSGLKSVFRKMFGRRGKDEVKRESVARHGYHRSDPGVLSAVQNRSKENANAIRARSKSSLSVRDQRISDLPVRELKPLNPLGAHLPFPMNVNAPEESSPSHDYLTFEHPIRHRRRATLPSVVLSNSEIAALSAIWSATGARVKPSEDRALDEGIPSPEIGIALSSPTHAKRRSRSAGALRELSTRQDSIPRRRSAEIRYWRTSGMDGSVSVYSTATPRPTTGDDTTHTGNPAVEEIEKGPSLSLPPETNLPGAALVDHHNETLNDPFNLSDPVPFEVNFGAFKSSFSESQGEDEEKDMTVESPAPSLAPLKLEDRVQRLESGMLVLEQSLHRLTGRSHRQTIILENAPKGRRANSASTVRDDADSRPPSMKSLKSKPQSRKSSGKSSTEALALKEDDDELPAGATFLTSPSSTHSMRTTSAPLPFHSQAGPQSSTTQPSAADQIAAVSTILRHERAARKALEQTVLTLQREVAELRAMLQQTRIAYPTPSPDGILGTHETEHVLTPRAHWRDTIRDERELGKERVMSRFSRSESEGGEEGDDEDEEMGVSTAGSEVTSPDVWATPKEEGSKEFFGRPGVVRRDTGENEMF